MQTAKVSKISGQKIYLPSKCKKKKIKYATKATTKRRSTEKASLALIHAHKQPRPGQQSREFIKCLQIGRGRRKPKNVRFDDGTNRLRAIYNNAYELAYTSLSWNWLILVNLQSADSRFGVRNASTLCRRAVNGGRVQQPKLKLIAFKLQRH